MSSIRNEMRLSGPGNSYINQLTTNLSDTSKNLVFDKYQQMRNYQLLGICCVAIPLILIGVARTVERRWSATAQTPKPTVAAPTPVYGSELFKQNLAKTVKFLASIKICTECDSVYYSTLPSICFAVVIVLTVTKSLADSAKILELCGK